MARRTREQIRIDRAAADRAEQRASSEQARETRAQQNADSRSSSSRKGPKQSLRSRLPGNPPTALVASEVVTLIAITAYDFLGPKGDGTGKLPDPRPIVATLAFWALLGLVGSVGKSLSTLVAWIGWILTSTVLVTGPRGKGLVLFVRQLGKIVTPQQAGG